MICFESNVDFSTNPPPNARSW